MWDNMAQNVVDMAKRGCTVADIMVETGYTLEQVSKVLANPSAAIAKYKKEEIPAKYRAAKMIHSAHMAKCEGCRWAHSRTGSCAGLPGCFREVFG